MGGHSRPAGRPPGGGSYDSKWRGVPEAGTAVGSSVTWLEDGLHGGVPVIPPTLGLRQTRLQRPICYGYETKEFTGFIGFPGFTGLLGSHVPLGARDLGV